MLRALAIAPIVLLATSACSSCSKDPEPKPKTKDEAFALFEKHKATYIRCEKLMAAEQPQLLKPRPAPLASAVPAPSASAPPAPSASAARAKPVPDPAPAPGDGGAKNADAGSDSASGTPTNAGASSAPGLAGSAPAVRRGEAQECQTDYWRDMKRDMGPFDQTTMDQWYLEWRKSVKLE